MDCDHIHSIGSIPAVKFATTLLRQKCKLKLQNIESKMSKTVQQYAKPLHNKYVIYTIHTQQRQNMNTYVCTICCRTITNVCIISYSIKSYKHTVFHRSIQKVGIIFCTAHAMQSTNFRRI